MADSIPLAAVKTAARKQYVIGPITDPKQITDPVKLEGLSAEDRKQLAQLLPNSSSWGSIPAVLLVTDEKRNIVSVVQGSVDNASRYLVLSGHDFVPAELLHRSAGGIESLSEALPESACEPIPLDKRGRPSLAELTRFINNLPAEAREAVSSINGFGATNSTQFMEAAQKAANPDYQPTWAVGEVDAAVTGAKPTPAGAGSKGITSRR
jgi:hypothetical protein